MKKLKNILKTQTEPKDKRIMKMFQFVGKPKEEEDETTNVDMPIPENKKITRSNDAKLYRLYSAIKVCFIHN